MKLAELLMERKAIKTKLEELKKRIYQNAQVQEGDSPTEDPQILLGELNEVTEKFENIIVKINQTNNVSRLDGNISMMEALIKKDMLNYQFLVYTNLADKATPVTNRYSQREIKQIPVIDIASTRKVADTIAKEYRILDAKIQEANWNIEVTP